MDSMLHSILQNIPDINGLPSLIGVGVMMEYGFEKTGNSEIELLLKNILVSIF
jgi:hypothetical protein